MDPRTQERVEQWDSRPFSGGYDGLADLAAGDFSGAIDGGGTWLFMLNGRIVGVVDGTIEDVESAAGTVYEAPDPALPLLCTMEERGGDTRAKYYTNETPLREVDRTLQNGSFTGYVELSENVLSGDYYAVYYGGRRMAAAYIGNAERLLTGDEAFERADDEVGIYEVVDVDIEVTDVPGTEPNAGADADSATTGGDGTTRADTTSSHSDSGTDSTDSRPEPSTDPTESVIESIDIGGTGTGSAAPDDGASSSPIDDVTADETSADASDGANTSGITATDEESVSESVPDGITDTDPSTETADSTGNDDRSPTSGTTSVSETDDDSSDGSSTDAVEPDTARSTSEAGQTSGSGPDPAEVEAAAQQLEESDISWTEEDVDSSDETATDDSTSSAAEMAESTASPAGDDDGTEERFEEEAQWRETRSIPSIDPDNSASGDSSADSGGSDDRSPSSRSARNRSATATTSEPAGTPDAEASRQSDGQRRSGRGGDTTRTDASDRTGREPEREATDQRVAELAERIERLEEQRDELVSTAKELESERDRLQSKNDDLTSTIERLQSRIESLEAELEHARGSDGSDATSSPSTRLSPEQALAGTNIFVRYGSKSQPTLETAHDGEADRSEVAANLQLEHHTEFDATDVAVADQPYAEFLSDTMEYRFADWLTEQLIYEIRDTDNARGLGDLYDAIPRIDRIEFDASISLEDDDTEDVPDRVSFDVVAFDKRGNPLIVANLDDSRDPATREMLERLEETGSAVKANYPDLAAATAVTSSFFEPGALDAAEMATDGGILSRGSKLSYVNLSRKTGYHLCLVESRSEGFHVTVPEL